MVTGYDCGWSMQVASLVGTPCGCHVSKLLDPIIRCRYRTDNALVQYMVVLGVCVVTAATTQC